MPNTPTLLNSWLGIAQGDIANDLAMLKYAVDILDQRTAALDTSGTPTSPFPVATFTLATLPDPAPNVGRSITVFDSTPPNTACISNGTNWLVITLGAIVS